MSEDTKDKVIEAAILAELSKVSAAVEAAMETISRSESVLHPAIRNKVSQEMHTAQEAVRRAARILHGSGRYSMKKLPPLDLDLGGKVKKA